MGITDRKITTWTNPIVNEADQPERSAFAMKGIFDANSNQLKAALNGAIDDLAASTGSTQIGTPAIAGLNGNTVGAQLAALMAEKMGTLGIKNLRITPDGYLEYTEDGTTWIKALTWGEVTIDPSGNARNLTVTFEQAESLANIVTGENMEAMFGKLMKWYVEFMTELSSHTNDITALESNQVGSILYAYKNTGGAL